MTRRIWAAILIAVLLLCACAGAEAPADSGAQTGAADFSRFSGLRIGVQTGTISGDVAEAMIPEIELRYFNTQTDVLAALRARKVDAWACELPTLQFVAASNSDLKIETMLDHTDLAALFARSDRGQALRDQYSAFVEKLWADGTMEEIREKWFSGDESRYTLPVYEALPAVNGTLRMALDPALPPFTFVLNGDEVGYDVDIAARFCEANGYALKIVPMDFNGVIASVQSGKCDFAACGITVTAERAESVLFSSPTYHSGTAMATIQGTAESAGFWAGIGESFEKTFIREDRWQLFLEGIGTTMLITLLAILLGTALGFAMFMICRNGNRFANAATRACTWLVQGTPTVVLLMILYYVVFGSVSVSGITVAVLGFTLTFGAAVYGLIRMGVGTIDRGQYEAACALGHSSRHTFFRIILPQAIPHILPAYQSEVVSLIKATAIVGYIAVQDLTRMGDIVRSRTYEAFFPLIAITVIYFALEALLGFAVSRVRIHIDPRKRSREKILKGCSEQSEASVGKPAMVPGREAADMAAQSEPAERPGRIRIEHLRKEYPNAVPLKDVNTEIRSGDVISVIGPSGTGKSTLLRSINQLEHPTAGRIWVNDQEITDPKCDITRVRQKMGMVFQSFNLFGHLTVIENIMLSPVDLLGKSRQEAYAEGMRLLRMVGLAEKALNYPDELSGGQKQRIAIARTLAMDPEVDPAGRAHQRAGPDHGRRGAGGHPRAGAQRQNHDDRDPRNELRPVDLEPRVLHGRGRHLRGRDAGADLRGSAAGKHPPLHPEAEAAGVQHRKPGPRLPRNCRADRGMVPPESGFAQMRQPDPAGIRGSHAAAHGQAGGLPPAGRLRVFRGRRQRGMDSSLCRSQDECGRLRGRAGVRRSPGHHGICRLCMG